MNSGKTRSEIRMRPAIYCDTSALAKLVLAESESRELKSAIDSSRCQLASSVISEVELVRACRRKSQALIETALELLAEVVLLPLTTSMIVRAGEIEPPGLRSLDAIHLATAHEIRHDLESLITYDERLVQAGVDAGIRVISPGVG